MARAVVLLSGGLDSATTLAVAKGEGYEVYALSVDYGQRHKVELDRAAAVAAAAGAADHRTVRLDLRAVGGSALTADGSPAAMSLPLFMTRTRSAKPNTTSMSCSVNRTASARLFASPVTSRISSPRAAGAMPAVGSSISSTRGPAASAMASSSRF